MCGLTGYTGNSIASPKIIQAIQLANDSRGGHSSGYYDGKEFVKCIGKNSKQLIPHMKKLNTTIFIGHTRYSTHGETTIPNQHPFQYGKVIGAHNGVLQNYIEVGEEYKCKETEVDSQMIFKVLNKQNNDTSLLGKFSGALATLFEVDGKLYTYRKGNPLWVGKDKKGGVYFSSLRDVLMNNKLKDIFQLLEGRLYVWEKGECIAKIDIQYDPVYSAYNHIKRNWWEGYGWNGYGTCKKEEELADEYSEEGDEYRAIEGSSPKKGHKGTEGWKWSKNEFGNLVLKKDEENPQQLNFFD